MTQFLLNWLPLLGTIFLTICYLPQIRKTWKTKDVSSMSLLFWISLNIALILLLGNYVVIFIETGAWGGMVTEALNVAFALVMMGLVIKYRKKKEK